MRRGHPRTIKKGAPSLTQRETLAVRVGPVGFPLTFPEGRGRIWLFSNCLLPLLTNYCYTSCMMVDKDKPKNRAMNPLVFQARFQSEHDRSEWLFHTHWPKAFCCPASSHNKYTYFDPDALHLQFYPPEVCYRFNGRF